MKIVNFTDLSQEDYKTILSWRDSDKVRKNMLNSNIISGKEHFLLVKQLKQDSSKEYFSVEDI
jgi:hypothetical protein